MDEILLPEVTDLDQDDAIDDKQSQVAIPDRNKITDVCTGLNTLKPVYT